jgi:hypothetical protein
MHPHVDSFAKCGRAMLSGTVATGAAGTAAGRASRPGRECAHYNDGRYVSTTAQASLSSARQPGFSTRCVHAGDVRDVNGALHPPLYNRSTFGFARTQDVVDILDGRADGALYTRYGMSPTIRALEAKLVDLEGAEAATLTARARSGDHIVCVGDLYGGTYELLSENLPELGITTTFLLAGTAVHLGRRDRPDADRLLRDADQSRARAGRHRGRVA